MRVEGRAEELVLRDGATRVEAGGRVPTARTGYSGRSKFRSVKSWRTWRVEGSGISCRWRRGATGRSARSDTSRARPTTGRRGRSSIRGGPGRGAGRRKVRDRAWGRAERGGSKHGRGLTGRSRGRVEGRGPGRWPGSRDGSKGPLWLRAALGGRQRVEGCRTRARPRRRRVEVGRSGSKWPVWHGPAQRVGGTGRSYLAG